MYQVYCRCSTVLQVTQKFGVAGLKQAMDWRGLYGGPVRAPLVPLTDDLQHALRNTFVTAGFTL